MDLNAINIDIKTIQARLWEIAETRKVLDRDEPALRERLARLMGNREAIEDEQAKAKLPT